MSPKIVCLCEGWRRKEKVRWKNLQSKHNHQYHRFILGYFFISFHRHFKLQINIRMGTYHVHNHYLISGFLQVRSLMLKRWSPGLLCNVLCFHLIEQMKEIEDITWGRVDTTFFNKRREMLYLWCLRGE